MTTDERHGNGRFTVVRSEQEVVDLPDITISEPFETANEYQEGVDGIELNVDTGEASPLTSLHLYEEDINRKGYMSDHLRSVQQSGKSVSRSPSRGQTTEQEEKKKGLGTIFGVFLPTMQNIFGVLIFIRVTWLVGNAGSLEGFFIIFLCCCSTTLTSISMSAIATNGVVPAGGSYFMISRALGPEFGGAVGILFYLGFTVAGSMYVIGAIEILVTFIAPQMSLFGDVTVLTNALNNYRLYGTILVVLLWFICFIGVHFVAKFGPFSLLCVVISIICIYIGLFTASPEGSVKVCFLGDRLLTFASVSVNGEMMCTKNETGPMYKNYCPMGADNISVCDPYFLANNASLRPGYPGLLSGNFISDLFKKPEEKKILFLKQYKLRPENFGNSYTKGGDLIGQAEPGDRSRGEIVADLSTSFTVLMAIYFPSVTGIMTGSNMSGDLKDAQKSIPVGTLGAVLTTSVIYLSLSLSFAAGIDGDLLRDKLGESLGGGLVIAYAAWPSKWVVLIGSFLSTIGAGLQSINGAPRLLFAIAKDEIVPFLGIFARTRRGEPFFALLLTAIIAEFGVLVGNLDFVTPLITMYFLTCYLFVNLACALQTILRAPSWRPRFRFYHWSLSLIGAGLCLTLMVISSWYYALANLVMAAVIYKYIEYKGAQKEWGDGIRGMAMSLARYSLLKVQQTPPHTKNWRPQLLILCKTGDNTVNHRKMAELATQLKAGKGLTVLASVLQGTIQDRGYDVEEAKLSLQKTIDSTGVKGFKDIVVSQEISAGLSHLIQTAGLGGLKPNTVMIGWPSQWHLGLKNEAFKTFMDTLKNIEAAKKALLVVKGVEKFPGVSDKERGTIDVWWTVPDGGMLLLLPYLLTKHKSWRNCKLRIFTIAYKEQGTPQPKALATKVTLILEKATKMFLYIDEARCKYKKVLVGYTEDNSIQMERDLQRFVYQLRIEAEVKVIEMEQGKISSDIYDKTMKMEQRMSLLKQMRKNSITNIDKATIRKMSKPDVKVAVHEPQRKYSVSAADKHHLTFTPSALGTAHSFRDLAQSVNKNVQHLEPEEQNVRRMHTAVELNVAINKHSNEARLVIINLPPPPKIQKHEIYYMEFLEVLTENLKRVILVRGSESEVITIYS